MTLSNLEVGIARSRARQYGFALSTTAIAFALALLAYDYNFPNVEIPLFLFVIAVTAWYAGSGPAALAATLAILAVDYYFTEPRYSFAVRVSDAPYFVVFVCCALLVARFSTVRRRVEQQLLQTRDRLVIEVAERTQQASLLNLTHDSIFVRDMDFLINYWNKGAQELYGWSAEEAKGRNSRQLLETAFPVAIDDILTELERTGRWEGELRRRKANGSLVVVASRWSLRQGDEGGPAAILETSNDITERKRREEEIQRLNQELASRSVEMERANKELEAFAYSVSHDLRAPLRHMSGYTELLQKRVSSSLDEKGHRYMAIILESAEQMGHLIDDLLAFSRIGRVEAQMGFVGMDQVIKDVMTDVRPETEGRTIGWKVGLVPDLYGDRSLLRLVMVNLLSNAVKFTTTRKDPEIEIGSWNGNGDEVVVFVRDNGVGFDMKYVDKLFGVFRRLHRADEFEGTGIGLATVQRIIHRHGGRVWAEGLVDGGATFYFSVPNQRPL
jgi:PAS domain S-box-containing protein